MNRRQRASVLMLMPAGVLVVLLLGAIAFDMSLVFLRQRQASSVATDVANDVVTAAVDLDHLRATGDYRLDPATAETLALDLVASSDLGDHVEAVEVTVGAPAEVEVRLRVEVTYVFARAIPGAADGTSVSAAARATALATP